MVRGSGFGRSLDGFFFSYQEARRAVLRRAEPDAVAHC